VQPQPYILGLSPAEPGPLSRFLPPLEEGVLAAWLPSHAPPGSWLLDPFGFAPRLALEAARAGYRVLVTANNPITRFLLEMAAHPPSESDFKAALADLAVSKKGEQRLETHLQSLYITQCEKCGREIQAEAFLWGRDEDAPYGRIYTCPFCEDSGVHGATPEDRHLARSFASTDALHRSRLIEHVAAPDDELRPYAEEAIQHYLPRPLYVLTTLLNRLESLYLTLERYRALTALVLVACDAGNTLWDHPAVRPRPKQLNFPQQFREHNLWTILEKGMALWTETAASVPCQLWPEKIPEGGGICLYEGRLSGLAHALKKEIPIAASFGSLPRPNQAFWTLSALWAGWLWGREAMVPYKAALRRRRYDWAWSATALNSTFTHLFELLPLGTPFFGFLPEPEPSFLTSALTAASAAGFDLQGLALRTQHDPIQIVWRRGEHLRREAHAPSLEAVREAIHIHLEQRGEPASYLYVHAAGLISLAESHALAQKDQDFDEALRSTHVLIQSALSGEPRFVHYSSGEGVETGLWGMRIGSYDFNRSPDSLADRVEVAMSDFLQENPECILLEIEADLYSRFPGLLTPSKAMVYAVLYSYAARQDGGWKLRPEDVTAARHTEVQTISASIKSIGERLHYTTRRQDHILLWEQKKQTVRVFYVLTSALVGRAIADVSAAGNPPYPSEQIILVIPGGRAALAAYKAQRDPALAARMEPYRLVKYRLLRAMSAMPILTPETFEEQIASDPIQQAQGQLMMF
jgi:hypothetical protein